MLHAYPVPQVFFYKRAQIFVGDLYGAFGGQGLGCFHDIDQLTMFAGGWHWLGSASVGREQGSPVATVVHAKWLACSCVMLLLVAASRHQPSGQCRIQPSMLAACVALQTTGCLWCYG